MTEAATLPQRVERARAALARVRGEKILVGEAERFQDRAQHFAEPAGKLAELIVPAETLRASGIPIQGVEPPTLEHWRRTFETLRRDFEAAPESILASDENTRWALLVPLKKLPESLRTALTVSWAAWVAQQKPAIGDELIAILAAVPPLRQQIAEIRTLRAQIDHLGASLPLAAATVETVHAACEELERRWETLSGGLSDDVLAFLRAAAGRGEGAPYAAVTDDVLAWLREHELLDGLRVRLSS